MYLLGSSKVFPARLSGGRRPSQGRVEVLISSTWGTVCDYGWDLFDANTVYKTIHKPEHTTPAS